jgi:hypothetical protein
MRTYYKIAPIIFLSFFLATVVHANGQTRQPGVQGLKGEATFTLANGAPARLQKGVSIPSGAVVRTGRQSAVDIYLGPEAGTIRLTQNSVLGLDKLDNAQTMLTLVEGSIVGWDAKVPAGGEFQVKLPNGIVGIVEGRYRLDARSYLVLLNGAMVYAYVPQEGQPRPYTMKAPPAAYFSPIEGVKPAPGALQKEVELQSKGKLR